MAAAEGRHHPLPPPPPPHHQIRSTSYNHNYQQAPTPMQKPQQRRAFSFRSDKSNGSAKGNLHETSAEKEAKRLHSKADPTLAMNEAEPAAVQATVKSSLMPLRSIQHRDSFGNPIAEPDRSNPTRSRWERPLDTIRSFEAAIDGESSRKSYIRPDTDSVANWNRRSSYYGNNGPRFPNNSYYGNRPPSSFRPESQYEPRSMGRDSYFDDQNINGGGGYGVGPSRHRASRMQSEPHLGSYRGGEQGVYPLPHKDRSYETVTSAAGSGSSAEPAGYQTDPTSSDNSSIDRNSPAKRLEPVNDYGIGFTSSSAYQPSAFTVGTNGNYGGPTGSGYQNQNQNPAKNNFGPPPPVPHKDTQTHIQRRPVAQQRPEMPEKRKSWFARRFSKAN